MQLSTKDFIRAVLLNESHENNKAIRDVLLPLYEKHQSSIVNMLTVTMMLVNEARGKSLSECLLYIESNFSKVVSVVEEYHVKLPEEEVQLEQIVKEISEDGEAPANVTAGIDAGTPRIRTKQSKIIEDEDVK